MKRALIIGITGQDGAYLAQLLLEKGYQVYGGYRRSANTNYESLRYLNIFERVQMLPLELLEISNIIRVLEHCRPDEVYNLGAQSFVGISFEQPLLTSDVTALGTLRVLEAIRTVNPKIRFYQASSSEMFGMATEVPQPGRHALLSTQSLCGFQGIRASQHSELQGVLRYLRLLRHPLQPRVSSSRTGVCDAEDNPGCCGDQSRKDATPLPRKPGCAAGLGLCARICRNDVENAAAEDPGRLRYSDG